MRAPSSGYEAEEHAYAKWARRFVKRVHQRLPDEPAHHIEAVLAHWSFHYQRLRPEDAAEIAAMWWHSEGWQGHSASQRIT